MNSLVTSWVMDYMYVDYARQLGLGLVLVIPPQDHLSFRGRIQTPMSFQ